MDVRQQQRRRRESYAPGRKLTWQRHSSLSVPRGPHLDGMQQVYQNYIYNEKFYNLIAVN